MVKMALQSILRMPEVLVPEKEDFTKDEWEAIAKHINEACDSLSTYRKDEGEVLKGDLEKRISKIEQLLIDVVIPEKTRIERVKDRIKRNLLDAIEQDKLDENRFR